MLCVNVSSGICRQQRPRSACAFAQSDQGRCCLQTESLDTIECFKGEHMPGRDVRLCRKMWICTFCACSKARFRLTGSIYKQRSSKEKKKEQRRSFYVPRVPSCFKNLLHFTSNRAKEWKENEVKTTSCNRNVTLEQSLVNQLGLVERGLNPYNPEFLKLTLPSLHLDTPIFCKWDCQCKIRNTKFGEILSSGNETTDRSANGQTNVYTHNQRDIIIPSH